MTQEDKELLLKDLSVRIPYGVKLLHIPTNEITTLELVGKYFVDGDVHDSIEYFKPYLFPLSSMTDEQYLEIEILTNGQMSIDKYSIWDNSGYSELSLSQTLDVIDWLNKNHFDYRGLIEKGLALDATGLNIY